MSYILDFDDETKTASLHDPSTNMRRDLTTEELRDVLEEHPDFKKTRPLVVDGVAALGIGDTDGRGSDLVEQYRRTRDEHAAAKSNPLKEAAKTGRNLIRP